MTFYSDWPQKRRYVVQKNDGIGGKPIPDDEPVLVIRAQDVLAAHMLNHYINLCGTLPVSSAVMADLYDHADYLQEWREHNVDLIKWPDR